VTITLHPVATADYPITIKKIDSSTNTVTIDPNGAETIDGAATVVIATQNTVSQLYSDGSAWRGGQQILTADNSDKLDGFHASQTPSANQIPVLDSTGALYMRTGSLFVGEAATADATAPRIQSYGSKSLYINELGNTVIIGAPVTIEGGTAWHSGNDGASSTLDADLLDGNSSAYFINTSNIGSQTVSAATTCTNATNATNATNCTNATTATNSTKVNGAYVIYGIVQADGTISTGSGGFTISKTGTGAYTVNFSPGFTEAPVLLCTAYVSVDLASECVPTPAVGCSTTACSIITHKAGTPLDNAFAFTIMGD